jgi:CRISPR-associated endonuclease Csy4
MDHYVDITLRPDPEFPAPLLMNALFAKLHRVLASHDAGLAGRVAVSFPGHAAAGRLLHLGDRLRLHGQATGLTALLGQDWLAGMRDHTQPADLAAVPATVQHRVVRRVQAQSSPERLRRRLARRHQLDAAEAAQRIPDSVAQTLRLPWVQLRSSSTDQNFRLFIEHGPLLPHPLPGTFSPYGLSLGATVPWF